MWLVYSLVEVGIGNFRACQVLEQDFAGKQLRRFRRNSLEYITRQESGGEQETATAGTARRDAVPPPLDFSDDDRGGRVAAR